MLYYWGSDEDGHHLRISIVNAGRLPIYIRQVEVKDKKGTFLGSMNTLDMDKNFLELNGHIKVVITDLEGKKYSFSKGWPVG